MTSITGFPIDHVFDVADSRKATAEAARVEADPPAPSAYTEEDDAAERLSRCGYAEAGDDDATR